jgi:hypothetical protein
VTSPPSTIACQMRPPIRSSKGTLGRPCFWSKAITPVTRLAEFRRPALRVDLEDPTTVAHVAVTGRCPCGSLCCFNETYWKIMGLAISIAVWTDPRPPNLAPEPQAWRMAAGGLGWWPSASARVLQLPTGLIIGREIARVALGFLVGTNSTRDPSWRNPAAGWRLAVAQSPPTRHASMRCRRKPRSSWASGIFQFLCSLPRARLGVCAAR